MVTGRTKGMTLRGKGNVVLVAAQLDDADGNPTEQYVFLRADEFGRLRTVDAGAVATFLGLTDTPASYLGQGLLNVRVNAAEDALEFAAGTGHTPQQAMIDAVGIDHWVLPGWAGGAVQTHTLTVNRLHYVPIYVDRSISYIRIGLTVVVPGAGGTVARLGIYEAVVNAEGQITPDALLLDAGTVTVDAGGAKEIVISETLAEGYYFLAFSSDGVPGIQSMSSASYISLPITGFAAVGGSVPSFVLIGVVIADGAAALVDPAPTPATFLSVLNGGIYLRDS